MVPFTAARTKKKRKKAATPVAPAGASVDASTATPAPSTAPVTKEGKTTRKKKAGKTIDLCTMPMWAKMTNSASHCIVAIAHGQKWVVGNAVTINGDVANKPSSGCQWYQKGPSSKRIAPSNPDFADMLWGRTRPTMTWAEGNKVGEGGLTKKNIQPLMGVVQWQKMMEPVADNERGRRAIEWTRDNRQQQIDNQRLMGVSKAGGDIAVKAKAVPAVNGAFQRCVDHGSGRKVGANGRAAVDNRQQCQQ
jgi:hypothetical protein